MRPSFVAVSLLALATSAVATFDKACPFPSLLIADIFKKKCQCVKDLVKVVPFNPGCTATYKHALIPYCVSTCPAPPHPSYKPKPKRNQPILMPDGTVSRCPSAMTACPLSPPPSLNGERGTATISMNEPYECVKPEEDLYNCGGCTSLGKGLDCNAIPGVRGTSCTEGKCMIYTCQRGYTLTLDENGHQECVRKVPRRM